jgi:hypothetical protein
MSNETLLNVWEAFEISAPKDICSYQTALFRFTLPGLGGRKPTGARLTSKEIAAAHKTLASISISPDMGDRLREAQKQTFELLNTPKERQRQPRYYINQFDNWAIKNQFFPSASLPEEELQYTFYPHKINRIKTTNRRKSKKFTFSFDVSDYAAEPLQPEQIQQHFQRINAEFADFKKYQLQQSREVTANNYETDLKRILGWLYREEGVSLAEISLSKLVPLIRLNFHLTEFESKEKSLKKSLKKSLEKALLAKIMAEATALQNIKYEAKKLVDLMEKFFGWLENPPSSKTRKSYIEALIAYSKYVYRSETDKTMALNFEDIPITNRLKVFHKEVENGKKKNSQSSHKYLPWFEVLGVLEKLRFEAELKVAKQGKYKIKRSLLAQAKSWQIFVLLGFFILVPPSRQRVIRELELGRTLKYGTFEHGRFTPVEKMTNPSEAKYYIHLQPEDYKTGDTYGVWLGEFPNTEFPDGSKFYDYLNRWLFQGYQDANGEWHGMRELIAAQEEKTIFVREQVGKAHDEKTMGRHIRNIFTRWAGVAITPQDLRHLYRTYIDDPATGATKQERESAAYWMRHSSQIAKIIYSHLNNEQKLRAGAQMSERLNQQLLGSHSLTRR